MAKLSWEQQHDLTGVKVGDVVFIDLPYGSTVDFPAKVTRVTATRITAGTGDYQFKKDGGDGYPAEGGRRASLPTESKWKDYEFQLLQKGIENLEHAVWNIPGKAITGLDRAEIKKMSGLVKILAAFFAGLKGK